MSGTKMRLAQRTGILSRYTQRPNRIASPMKRSDAVAIAGSATNVPAIWRLNSATTRMSADHEKRRKRIFPGRPRIVPITEPIDSPSCRTERKSAIMSCAAPISTHPNTIHSVTEAQPNSAARTGPTIGPAPAMAAKWCPNSTVGCAGT